MSTGAKVTSVEAIEAFRNHLIIYLSKARPTLDEISSDVTRLRMWVENEQRMKWEGEFRRRKQAIDDAQNALFSAKMSNLREPTAAERIAVTKAKNAYDAAEEKLRVIKRWDRELSSQVDPLAKQLEHLHTVLTGEMPHALAYLSKVIETLRQYSSVPIESTKPEPTEPNEP